MMHTQSLMNLLTKLVFLFVIAGCATQPLSRQRYEYQCFYVDHLGLLEAPCSREQIAEAEKVLRRRLPLPPTVKDP
jgi:hypothetical protein